VTYCPADVDPAFAGPQFRAVAAGDITQNGGPVLKVLAGELKSGSGDETYFNVPVAAEGYAYAAESTVVIAFDVAGGSHAETAQEAFAKVLDGLH